MKVVSKISQDLSVLGVKREIYAVQNDANTREIQISLFSNGAEWIPPEGVSVSVGYKKQDGSTGRYDKLPNDENAILIEKNIVSIILAPAILSSAENVDVSVIFQDENLNQVSSFSFVVKVQPNTTTSEFVENNYYNYSTLEEINDALENDFAPAIISSADGMIATAMDSANRKMAALNLYGRSIQDGVPAPESPVDIEVPGEDGQINVLVYGKNICKPKAMAGSETQFGVNINYVEPGLLELNGTSSASLTQNVNYSETILLPQGKYTISCKKVSGYSNNIVFYFNLDNGDSVMEQAINDVVAFNCSEPTHFSLFFKIESNSSATGARFQIQLENNSNSTKWEPFKDEKTLLLKVTNGLPGIPVYHNGSDYAANYTDASGQKWICDEIDLVRGVYVQRIFQIVLDGSEEWTQSSSNPSKFGTNSVYYEPLKDFAPDKHYNDAFFLCSHFQAQGYYAHTDGGVMSYLVAVGGALTFWHSGCTSIASWNAYLAEQAAVGTPVTLLLRKDTPIEIPLPAATIQNFKKIKTNKETTTVFSNEMPNISFEYVADTKSYIDQKLSAISAAIVNG